MDSTVATMMSKCVFENWFFIWYTVSIHLNRHILQKLTDTEVNIPKTKQNS